MSGRVIFHIDANSAFLSWTAAYRVRVLGEKQDLREIPSVVAGDKASRKSIILAKSIPAKKFWVQTGEPLFEALEKCPYLAVVEPDFGLYVEASRHMIAILERFSPLVEQYSIDEAWVDMSGTRLLYGAPVQAANLLRETIWRELGFTVNVGVSSNKLLAKMAGDFQKPNLVHTLFPDELEAKMWPLPVRELFMVGPATEAKLRKLGIYTIGQLARSDPKLLRQKLGKFGDTVWHFANGRCDDAVLAHPEENKGYGNAVTTPFDVTDRQTASQVLLSLCETVGARMRRDGKSGRCVTISMRTAEFADSSHQARLHGATDVTAEIHRAACRLFDEAWDGVTPLRQLGVQVTELSDGSYCQFDLFSPVKPEKYERQLQLDRAVDSLRDKYGEDVVRRARFVGSEMEHMAGGLSKERRTGVTKKV